jgi:adenine phosphoribosyltransferase
LFASASNKSLKAQTLSISDATKQAYAAATGADFKRILCDRAYKEHHRPALTKYFENEVRQRPHFPEEQFLQVVENGVNADVLFITGMRDKAPLAYYSHFVPESRVLEVRVGASKDTRQVRRGHQDDGGEDGKNGQAGKDRDGRPSFDFNNDMAGSEAAEECFKLSLLPFFHEDLQRLANMIPLVPGFPRPGVDFRHMLNISQRPGGLALCTSLLQQHLAGDWAKVDALVFCESGGFVFVCPLAAQVDKPLALIREAGKLPPPTISVMKSASHVSFSASSSRTQRIEMGRDVIPRDSTVVVVDDVLATGETLCAVLQLLNEAGIAAKDVTMIVVAEFPFHRGRQMLHQHGFGGVKVQSLLVFGGA